jgi:hypothetical protein
MGLHFVQSAELSCIVGPAMYVSGSMVLCMMDGLLVGNMTVEVSNNEHVFCGGGPVFRASLRSPHSEESCSLSLDPSMGSVMGGTAISLLGGGIGPNDSVTCVFGQTSFVTASLFAGVSADEYVHATCITQVHVDSATTPAVVKVRVCQPRGQIRGLPCFSVPCSRPSDEYPAVDRACWGENASTCPGPPLLASTHAA